MLRKTITDFAVKALVSRPLSTMMSPVRRHVVPIFMIHRIENSQTGIRGHQRSVVEAALQFVRQNGYQVISLRKLVQSVKQGKPLPEKAVCFTMDDGFADQATDVLPLFAEAGYPITFFLATDMLDKQHWSWDYQMDYLLARTEKVQVNAILAGKPYAAELTSEAKKRSFLRLVRSALKKQPISVALEAVEKLSDVLAVPLPAHAPAPFQTMTWDQARHWESDLIEFAPHSCQHAVFSQLEGDVARHEIEHSWQRLQEELRHPCPVFCYPTGRSGLDFNGRDKQLVENCGLEAAVSADPGYVMLNGKPNDLYALPRFSFPDHDLSQFQQYCSWVERAKEMVTHRV